MQCMFHRPPLITTVHNTSSYLTACLHPHVHCLSMYPGNKATPPTQLTKPLSRPLTKHTPQNEHNSATPLNSTPYPTYPALLPLLDYRLFIKALHGMQIILPARTHHSPAFRSQFPSVRGAQVLQGLCRYHSTWSVRVSAVPLLLLVLLYAISPGHRLWLGSLPAGTYAQLALRHAYTMPRSTPLIRQ